ncbi:MAG: hypothetical protein H7331_06360 [Bacteroidia bacterium]|nr:hypothetical protein [Bacteroidia bacterium]
MRNSNSLHTRARSIVAILAIVVINSGITKAQTFITKGFTQLSFDNATQEIHESIYNYNFATADSLLRNYVAKTNVSNWSKLIYINYYWWQILTGNDKDKVVRIKFNAYTNQIIINLTTGKNKLTPLSNENLYVLANAYAFKTRLNLLEGEYLKGLLNLNKSIDYIQKCVGKEDVFEAFTIQTALLYYFVEYSRINKPITRPYLASMPPGSMIKGLALLQKGAKSADAIIATECTYFLAKIYGEVEHNYNKSEVYCLILTKKHPDNIAYQMNLYDCYINQNKHTDAQHTLTAIHRLSKTLPNLTPAQREYFINEAKKHSEKAYLKEIKKK